MYSSLRLAISYALFTALFIGCDATSPGVCPDIVEPAIVVQVTDARTGHFIAADAEGVIVEGTYRDSLRHFATTPSTRVVVIRSLAAGLERPGTYDVFVDREGYESWSREDVHVQSGECGPETEHLEAALETAA